MNFFHSIGNVFIGIGIFLGSIFGVHAPIQAPQDLGAAVQPSGVLPATLSGSGISSSASSLTVTSFTIPQTGQLIQDSDLSSTFYLTLESGNRTKQEFISCTTLTQNSGGTATFSGCIRGLSPIYPYAASTTLALPHGGGTNVVVESNSPSFYSQFAALANNNLFTGQQAFTLTPTSTPVCASASELCNKTYVDSVAIAGASNSDDSTKGIVEMATRSEASTGTSFGGTGARLALGANIATSSCITAQNQVLVASSTTGKLSGNCFDTTNNAYTFTKAITFNSATSTFNATTSIAASANTAPLIINGVTTSWPSTAPTASSTPVFDTSGNVTYTRPEFTLIASTTLTSVLSTTTLSWTAPAGGTDLKIVIAIPSFSGNVPTVYINFNGDTGNNYTYGAVLEGGTGETGGTSLGAFSLIGNPGSNSTVGWHIVFNMSNAPALKKLASWTGSRDSNASVFMGGGSWNNTTARVSSITVGGGNVNTMAVGTKISVYASSQ